MATLYKVNHNLVILYSSGKNFRRISKRHRINVFITEGVVKAMEMFSNIGSILHQSGGTFCLVNFDRGIIIMTNTNVISLFRCTLMQGTILFLATHAIFHFSPSPLPLYFRKSHAREQLGSVLIIIHTCLTPPY